VRGETRFSFVDQFRPFQHGDELDRLLHGDAQHQGEIVSGWD
jgi:hypothetical protein